MKPVILPPHQLRCFYQGGARIAALRGDGGDESWSPEEWIASTTPRYGEVVAGLSALPGGQLLREAIQADPGSWLGAEHVAAFGADPAILVKLLDAGERLPVHVHPTRDFSRQHRIARPGRLDRQLPEPLRPLDWWRVRSARAGPVLREPQPGHRPDLL